MEIPFLILQILKSWWWFFLPLLLFLLAKFFYFWWLRWEIWYKKNQWILLEIKPPAEVLKPFKAMEDLITSLWGVYDTPIWRERWCEGMLPSAPFWFSMEIASFGGEIHFYVRILDGWKNLFESAIYAHYPETEISVVEDYTKKVPQNIPNEKWDMEGYDYGYVGGRDYIYPIKTYSAFFEKEAEETKIMEEKRVDPLDSLLEALSELQSGEQFWFQIVADPILDRDIPFKTHGKEVVNRLAKRPEVKKPKPMWEEAAEILISGPPAEEKKEESLIAPELRLTPGEKEILQAVERKISKYNFKVWTRGIYLYKINEPRFANNKSILHTYFQHFSTEHLNAITFNRVTRTKIHYWLRKRRLYLRKRKQFRDYIERFPPYFPWNLNGNVPFVFDLIRYPKGLTKGKGIMVFSAEELASVFHFPPKITVPTMARVEAKKAGPPSGLPTE